MISLTALAAHPLVHALGWTLMHFCWQGAMVAGMLWCVLGLLGGRSSHARYCAACSAMLLIVALPLLTFVRVALVEYQARNGGDGMPLILDVNLWLTAGTGGAAQAWSARLAQALDHSMPWVLVAWLLGAMFFMVRLNFGLVAAHRMRHAGVEPASDELLHRFEVLRRRLGVTRAVRLLNSARLQVPTVIGWLRPVVLIPVSCLMGLSQEQVDAILCHELAHVRRHDYLVSVFQSLAEALLFYHPAVWWVSKQVRRERECCCDELAVANCGDALVYARALSYLEERRAALPEFALGANGGVLSMRIKRLLGCANEVAAPQFAALLLVALLVAIGGFSVVNRVQAEKTMQPAMAAAMTAPAGQHSGAPLASDDQPLRGAYETWLSQDALWIITDQERAAYLRLTNDNEREAFIAEFWRRRDTPGAAAGSYRDAYYARIAYSNEHFASDRQVGWRSDRGHVYLLYGKPDSIDSHPSGGVYQSRTGQRDMAYPFEVWHYATSAADIVFVDTCRCGEYHLTADGTGVGARSSGAREGVQAAALLLAPGKMSVTPVPVRRIGPEHVASAAPVDATRLTQLAMALPPPPLRQNQMQPSDDAVRVSTNVMQQALIYQVNPIYPAIAKAAHVQGVVVLSVQVSKQGTVSEVKVISGAPMLIASAVDAVRQWAYKPYLLNGEPTEVQTTINVNYTYGEAASPAVSPTPGIVDADGQLDSAGPYPRSHVTMADGATAPMLVFQVDPEFSEEARKAKFMGVVLVNLKVDEHGIPQDVRVLRRVGMGLDQKAVEAVSQYRFKPAMKDGVPVEEALNVEVNFQIF